MIKDLIQCGLNADLISIDAANKAINDELKKLTGGAGGISAQITNVRGQLGAKLNISLSQLSKLIPEIPDLPPNLPKMIAAAAALASDPTKIAELAVQSAQIRLVFGGATTIIDLDTLLNDPKSLLAIDLCKAIPNVDAEAVTDALGNVSYKYTVKGLPPTKPTENAKKPPEPPTPKTAAQITPVVNQREDKPKPTAAEKEVVGPLVKPTVEDAAAPAEIKEIIFNKLYNTAVMAPASRDIIARFVKTAAPDGSGYFWKPTKYETQLDFETAMYLLMKRNGIAAYEIQKSITESGSGDSTSVALAASAAERQAAATQMAQGGSSTVAGAITKINGVYSTTVDQAKLSFVPKPEGEFLGNFGIKAD